ncbi:MAG TPA: lipase maturation factor family protein [Polyangiaceae bacterium]|jgi:hypothetical protein
MLAPELVWGLLSRGIALVYFVSFASMTNQVLTIAGSRGYTPLDERLARLRRDFPTWRRFAYFPTLSWIYNSDRALASFPWLGLVAAAAAIAGGPYSPWAFLACYVLYLTLDRVLYLMFPWDSMLFEAGVFAIFLPPLHALPDVTSVAAPDPALAWVYRLLLFRVIFGFGKFKFLGSTNQDTGYLKGFLINQPLPSPIGWAMQKLPMPLLKMALYMMFAVEIPLPMAVFAPRYSPVAALAIDAFMLVIWTCGTFGYFSLVMIVVSLSWFDPITASAFSFTQFFAPSGHTAALHALIGLHVVGAILSFPLNSYCSMTWLTWPVWLRIRPRVLTAPIVFYRALHPFRWLHSYGVFPPKPAPPVKAAPVMEVTWDGMEWHTLGHHYSPTTEYSRPKFCSPHHARLDQSFIYDVFGLNDATVLRNLVGVWDPYGHVHAGGSWLMMRRALEGSIPSLLIDPKTIPKAAPPIAARVRTYTLEPTTFAELRATGRWWKKTLMGPHSGPVSREGGFGQHALAPPELWHFDDLVWLRRSSIGTLMDRVCREESPHDLVLVDADGFGAEDVARFWDEFLPGIAARRDDDWSGLRALVEGLRAKYGRDQLYRFERIAGRYGALLFAKLEPLFVDRGIAPAFGRVQATLDVKTHYHLGLLTRHVLAEGRAAYDAVVDQPRRANEHLPKLTMRSGAFLFALFRYEIYVIQSQKFRLMEIFLEPAGRRPLPEAKKQAAARLEAVLHRLIGPLEMADFLKTQFRRPEDSLDVAENWTQYAFNADGSLKPVVRPEAPLSPAPSVEPSLEVT